MTHHRAFTWRLARPAALAALLALALSGCAPAVQAPLPRNPAAKQADATARIIYHQMAIGYLETGKYTTNVLVDVPIPKGVRWTVEAYGPGGTSYRLRVTSSQVPGIVWEVSPSGVRRVASP